MQIAKIVTIVKISFATAGTGRNKMTGNHVLILRNDFQNDKYASRPGRIGPGLKIYENLGPVRRPTVLEFRIPPTN